MFVIYYGKGCAVSLSEVWWSGICVFVRWGEERGGCVEVKKGEGLENAIDKEEEGEDVRVLGERS